MIILYIYLIIVAYFIIGGLNARLICYVFGLNKMKPDDTTFGLIILSCIFWPIFFLITLVGLIIFHGEK